MRSTQRARGLRDGRSQMELPVSDLHDFSARFLRVALCVSAHQSVFVQDLKPDSGSVRLSH